MDSTKAVAGNLMVRAYCAAFASFAFGLSLGHILIKHLDIVYLGVAVLSGAAAIFVFFGAPSAVQRCAVSEAARQSGRQFL